ncbi:hypothetical protein M9H77_01384 [Catharanthus roseus]|uniref:Uncharacterized protein n=1 Tax=Catharanthus roseus TaxID=4058 RepID=A0ACC0C5M2_CATRO|nr:hypothetical protein M9H77_01384 [Catharanthus roseus]
MVSVDGGGGGNPKQLAAAAVELEETELRLGLGLGLPGGSSDKKQEDHNIINANGKRNFAQTMDLKLNLASAAESLAGGSTRDSTSEKNLKKEKELLSTSNESLLKPPAKAQVVGWPPVRSYRKNILGAVGQKKSGVDQVEEKAGGGLVKVSMDGAPYLRKVDLNMYKSYQQLSTALGKMFQSFTIGNCESQQQGMLEFMNESKLIDVLNSSDYVPTYEDKDGDWMLVGDVPWEMFVESCKRLRIMKGTEAIGLAPRALAKCKNRS